MRTVWRCEFCGADYDTYDEAITCESKHLKPDGVVAVVDPHGSEYPYEKCSLRDYCQPSRFPAAVIVAFKTPKGGVVQKTYVRGDAP